MGTHAKPRTRVRAVALSTLAVGATLTAAGLTAAALEPTGASLADGAQSADPVNLAGGGLGAPVPVANVSDLDAGVPQTSVAPVAQAAAPRRAPAPAYPRTEPTSPGGTFAGTVPQHQTPQSGTAATATTVPAATTTGGSAQGGAGDGSGTSSGSGSGTSTGKGSGSGNGRGNGGAGAATTALLGTGAIGDALTGPVSVADASGILNQATSTVGGLLGSLSALA
ncbi:hypothetical protein KGA66_27935 [Actinocrinis puniceicyclus]|uniref:Uncharacterized protein n=1 Tax=Actinocrinis puniceicyclus TaxID=977794 RepID=A0A8J7WQY1_9ACTN|nr:hypothetical protein [Actinocrinis puniceicyclus]MBS2966896.1 hypothetical protein [Actinocrinis puniceicyclus]